MPRADFWVAASIALALGGSPATSLAAPTEAAADDAVVNEAVIDGPADEIWRLITTKSGMESWMVPHAEVDLRVGGFVRTNHAPDGKIGDPRTVTNRILALQPKQKFSFQIAEVPDGIPMIAMLVGTQYEVQLRPLSRKQTRVRCMGRGFPGGPLGYTVRAFADRGSEWALQQLEKVFVDRKARARSK
ncbi:MAG: SRPBCC domain-containing protein [Candidatus Eisenbacteria bacterium]|uniref:SRPBCC domain-containing protein n=1 Tax=Eiseniibacteriota bacterium TaxID=2212470 RepID=A0A538TRM2_UNCEI|nr:MAG: SRPBCC domain-containing protein [Candidatus Eisenbacteria bacterium]